MRSLVGGSILRRSLRARSSTTTRQYGSLTDRRTLSSIERRMIEHPGNRVAGGLGKRTKRRLRFLVAHCLDRRMQTLLHSHGLNVAV
jgi:hypothetical protein